MEKTAVAILGSGNIGTDLMYKLKRSNFLRPVIMAGIVADSEGLARARQEGLAITSEGIEGLLKQKETFEIVFDATTGQSGNDGRDRKMHKEVLESARYPEISFRPDRIEGNVAPTGTSSIRVHGMFGIHGAEHEITSPIDVKFDSGHWTASAHFLVPYAKWGMQNPSVFLLRVGDTVNIELQAGGDSRSGPK